jgi:hypothetical protein
MIIERVFERWIRADFLNFTSVPFVNSGRRFITKLARKYFRVSTMGNESKHECVTVLVVNSATSCIVIFKSTVLPHRNVIRYILTALDGKVVQMLKEEEMRFSFTKHPTF